MKKSNANFFKQFLGKWILAISIAWPAGAILAIILSYAIVNLFYPKETNLIVGLCIGGAVGFAQWLVFKKSFRVGIWWIISSALGVGLTSVAMVLLEETETINPGSAVNEYISWFIAACVGGFLNGIFQLPSLRKISKHSVWWVAVSTFGWGFAMLSHSIAEGVGFIFGGVLLACITGFSFLWLLKFPVNQ
jgi:hypothetical protein